MPTSLWCVWVFVVCVCVCFVKATLSSSTLFHGKGGYWATQTVKYINLFSSLKCTVKLFLTVIFFKELNRKNNPSLLTQLTPNIILEFTLYLNRLHVRSKWSHRKGKKAKTTTHSPHGLHLHCVHLQPHKKKSIFWIPRVICWQLERWLKSMFYKRLRFNSIYNLIRNLRMIISQRQPTWRANLFFQNKIFAFQCNSVCFFVADCRIKTPAPDLFVAGLGPRRFLRQL